MAKDLVQVSTTDRPVIANALCNSTEQDCDRLQIAVNRMRSNVTAEYLKHEESLRGSLDSILPIGGRSAQLLRTIIAQMLSSQGEHAAVHDHFIPGLKEGELILVAESRERIPNDHETINTEHQQELILKIKKEDGTEQVIRRYPIDPEKHFEIQEGFVRRLVFEAQGIVLSSLKGGLQS